jgi:hypothetical protein
MSAKAVARPNMRLRTQVSADDSLEAINARVEHFVEATPKPGRVERKLARLNLR